jgi:hypothetical protein
MISFLYHCQDFYRTWLYILVTGCMSYKKMELLVICEHLKSFLFFLVGFTLLISLFFCVVLLCAFTFCVLCCDFRIKTMFGSYLPPVVCESAHFLFTLFMFVCTLWCPTNIVLCFCFVCQRVVYSMLPGSLDCPLLFAPSVLSNVYWIYSNPRLWVEFVLVSLSLSVQCL